MSNLVILVVTILHMLIPGSHTYHTYDPYYKEWHTGVTIGECGYEVSPHPGFFC